MEPGISANPLSCRTWVGVQVLGSVYIPEVNYIMMILTVVVVAVFKTTIQLGNAYGTPLLSSLQQFW